MQKSSVSISLSFENQGINPVGDNEQVTKYLHKQKDIRKEGEEKANLFENHFRSGG